MKISWILIIKKTEFALFRSPLKKVTDVIKVRLGGQSLIPTQTVKSFGILFDQHLKRSSQISQVTMKLNRGIGILSRLRKETNTNILKMAYHLLFESHLLYGCQLGDKSILEHKLKWHAFKIGHWKNIFLGHLMRQLKITNTKHLRLWAWSPCKTAYLCPDFNRITS